MPTIESLTERADAVSPQTLGSEVFARFERETDTLVIAVVDGHSPIGLIERNDFLLKIASPFGHALYAGRPVVHVMDPEPPMVEAGVAIDTVCDALIKGGADTLMRGFIVTRDGRYHGVGTVASMLRAVNKDQRCQNAALAEQVRHPGAGVGPFPQPVPDHHEP
jgi:two-component system, sensor histidine kinase